MSPVWTSLPPSQTVGSLQTEFAEFALFSSLKTQRGKEIKFLKHDFESRGSGERLSFPRN